MREQLGGCLAGTHHTDQIQWLSNCILFQMAKMKKYCDDVARKRNSKITTSNVQIQSTEQRKHKSTNPVQIQCSEERKRKPINPVQFTWGHAHHK